jgi:hypothetical protein
LQLLECCRFTMVAECSVASQTIAGTPITCCGPASTYLPT